MSKAAASLRALPEGGISETGWPPIHTCARYSHIKLSLEDEAAGTSVRTRVKARGLQFGFSGIGQMSEAKALLWAGSG